MNDLGTDHKLLSANSSKLKFSQDGKVLMKADKTIKAAIIKDGVVRIEPNAFEDCEELQVVFLPPSLEFIGNFAFHNCKKLRFINFPEPLQYIGGFAFQNCASLKRVFLCHSLEQIGANAFEGSGVEFIRLSTKTQINKGLSLVGMTKLRYLQFERHWDYHEIDSLLPEVLNSYIIPHISITSDNDSYPQTQNGILMAMKEPDIMDEEEDDYDDTEYVTAIMIPYDVMCLPEQIEYLDEYCFTEEREKIRSPFLYIPKDLIGIHPHAFDLYRPKLITQESNLKRLISILPESMKEATIFVI